MTALKWPLRRHLPYVNTFVKRRPKQKLLPSFSEQPLQIVNCLKCFSLLFKNGQLFITGRIKGESFYLRFFETWRLFVSAKISSFCLKCWNVDNSFREGFLQCGRVFQAVCRLFRVWWMNGRQYAKQKTKWKRNGERIQCRLFFESWLLRRLTLRTVDLHVEWTTNFHWISSSLIKRKSSPFFISSLTADIIS